MDVVVERCAGLDVHRDDVVATVRVPGRRRPPLRSENPCARIDAGEAWCVRARATAWRGDLWDR